jgi:metal-responsive CopG/Arc/MetJ family transcriptional regulator
MAQVKTAVSLDKSLFEQIDTLAHKMKVSRSRLFAMALEDFLRRHENERLLQQINRACLDEPDQARQAQRQGMRRLHRKIVEGEW